MPLLAMALAGLGATLLFVLGAAPSVYWLDSAELTASAFGLGVCHPTGFPLLHVLGKAATLLPVGSIGFRMNLLAAVCGGATVGLLYGLTYRAMGETTAWRRHVPAVVASFVLTSAHTFWLHAVVAEIYSLNALWIAGALWFVWDLADDVNPRSYFSLCLWVGLGVGTHVTFPPLIFGGFLCLVLLRHRDFASVFLPFSPRAGAFLVLGSAILLYLPLAGLRQPLHQWGFTETLGGFIDQITARSIRGAFQNEISGWNAFAIWVHSKAHFGQLWQQAAGGILLAIVGVIHWAQRRRWVTLAVALWIVLFDGFFSIKINPMGIHERQTGIPSLLAIALLAGAGCQWVLATLASLLSSDREPQANLVGTLLCLGAGMFCFPDAAGEKWQTNAFAAYDYSAMGAEQAEIDALVVSVSDSTSAGWLYLQGCENRRPDTLFVIRQFLGNEVYHTLLRRRHPRSGIAKLFSSKNQTLPAAEQLVLWAFAHDRPVRWEIGDTGDRRVDRFAEGDFPLFKLTKKPGRTRLADLQRTISTYLKRQVAPLSQQARIQLGGFHRYLVPFFVGHLAYASAITAVQRALHWNNSDARALINQGVLAAMAQEYSQAERFAARAARIDPLSLRAWLNLATYRRVQNKLKLADAALNSAERLDQPNYRLYYERAMIAIKRKQVAAALRYAQKSAKLNPRNPAVRQLLTRLKRERSP